MRDGGFHISVALPDGASTVESVATSTLFI